MSNIKVRRVQERPSKNTTASSDTTGFARNGTAPIPDEDVPSDNSRRTWDMGVNLDDGGLGEDDLLGNLGGDIAEGPLEMEEPKDKGEAPDDNYISLEMEAPPLDWSIKLKARFTSPSAFAWASGTTAVDEAQGLRDFLGQEVGFANKASHSSSADAQSREVSRHFHEALLSWMQPSDPFGNRHPLLLATREARNKALDMRTPQDKIFLDLWDKRWLEWESSFRSLYYQLRHGELSFFYYHTPQYTILFNAEAVTAKRQASGDGPQAIISQSTSSFRTQLAKCGVGFTMPLYKEDGTEEKNSETALKDLERFQGFRKGKTKNIAELKEIANDNTARSALLISGSKDVHALYDVLLNVLSKRHEDVPTLHAPSAFINGTVKQAQVIKNTPTTSTGGSAGGIKTLHTLEVLGPLLPFNVVRLCALLGDAQGSFEARLWTDPSTFNLNGVATPVTSKLAGLGTTSFFQQPEVATALSTSIYSETFTPVVPSITRIRCTDGTFHAALT